MSQLDTLLLPGITGGVSTQPSHQRFPDQVQQATDFIFDIAAGARRRPGTRFVCQMSSPAPNSASILRVHPIDRDSSEKYLVVYGKDGSSSNLILRVYTTAGVEKTVTISSDAEAYLERNAAGADDLALVTLADFTLIINRTVAAHTTTTPDYAVTATFLTEEAMKRRTPADETYHQADDEYWFYDVDAKTFATIQFPTISGYDFANPSGEWNDSGNNFQARFIASRQNLNFSTATFTTATKVLTKVGAFTNYTNQNGDRIKITGGTGVTPGWYTIASRDSDDQITLDLDIGGTDPADVSATYIGTRYEFVWTTLQENDTMDDVASDVQARWAADTVPYADRVLVAWTSTGAEAGYFTITSPYRGSGATIEMQAAGAGTDFNASGKPFYATGATITGGSGTVGNTPADQTSSVDSRWTQVNAPGEPDAGLDPLTLPVKMIRTASGNFSVDTIDWNARASGDATTNPSPDLFRKATSEGLITAISIANPGVVTSAGHGLSNGDVIHIVGSDSTPSIDGVRTVANVTTDTFTVGVNTSGAGTEGSWSKGSALINDAVFFENRLVLIGDELIAMGQSGDFFNFYKEDQTDLIDSDPISRRVTGDQVSVLDYAVPVGRSIVLFARSGQQFEVTGGDNGLTPTNATVIASTRAQAEAVAPAIMNTVIYFAGRLGTSGVVREYFYQSDIVTPVVSDVTTHIRGYLPTGATSIAADEASRTVILTKRDTSDLYCYRAFWQGQNKVQSAWSTFSYDATYDIQDAQFLGGSLYILSESGGVFIVERQPMTAEGAASGFPAEVFGDRQITVTGSLVGSDTVFALGMTGSASTIDRLVKGNAFTGEEGDVVSSSGSWSFSTTNLTIASTDLTDGPVILCGATSPSLVLSRPYDRDQSGRSRIGTRMTIYRFIVSHVEAGGYTVSVAATGKSTRTLTFNPSGVEASGFIVVPTHEDADAATITIAPSSLDNLVVTGVEYLIEAHPMLRI